MQFSEGPGQCTAWRRSWTSAHPNSLNQMCDPA